MERMEPEWNEFKQLPEPNKTAIVKAISDISDGRFPIARFRDETYEEFLEERFGDKDDDEDGLDE